MKTKTLAITAFLSISILFSFNSFADYSKLIDADYEKSEIISLEDEVIRKINEGGPRSELTRDVTENDIDFSRAYRVYANSELFDAKTDHAEEIREILQNGKYIWQIPIFIGNDTVLVDIFKDTEISDDIPEDVKEKLRETLGQWQVGAMYVYDNRTVDYQNAVRESLAAVKMNIDDYAYEFVSGLPGIRYPIAVIFDQNEAKYMIPAEQATARAFEDGSEAMEYTASPSNTAGGHTKSPDEFPVYHFNDVSKASRNSSAIGLGGAIGISPQNASYHNIYIAALIIGGLGIVVAVTKKLKKVN